MAFIILDLISYQYSFFGVRVGTLKNFMTSCENANSFLKISVRMSFPRSAITKKRSEVPNFF